MKKVLSFVAIIAIGVFIFYKTGLIDELHNVSAMQTWFQNQGFIGYFAFILLSVVTAVFMLPGGMLAIVAGIAFGGFIGGLLTVIGSTVGASISFILGRTLLKDAVVKKYGDNPTFNKIMNGVNENGVSFLILTRLVPIFPYAIQSYAYALTPMGFWKFSLISGITMLPACFIYAYMASDILTQGLSFELAIKFTILGIVLFLLTYVPKKIAQHKKMI
ncbi:TVP38/TMEM64 family protein [Companilactobacillus mishanensis]|uniref:TVP38/TMEM64 family membrane protein n=1 Tax=Companilactobacillus mishanensis TaxID=2486008 RepID=A0A5P0ZG76_9LACO|nr:TVP38/TMEM64 family protein [Companilactobacillus mishanensis]MQS52009.1 TVP38/TMEM64 family protein [Companilactobacillus mishanensis]